MIPSAPATCPTIATGNITVLYIMFQLYTRAAAVPVPGSERDAGVRTADERITESGLVDIVW